MPSKPRSQRSPKKMKAWAILTRGKLLKHDESMFGYLILATKKDAEREGYMNPNGDEEIVRVTITLDAKP